MEARGFSSAPDSCASRVNPCDVWPFAKLPNGFGSHMYLYSPTSFDSQDLNTLYLPTRSSCHARAAPVSSTYYSTTTRGTWAMGMRTTSYHLSFLAAGAASGYYCASKPLGFCQWKFIRHASQQTQLRGTLVVTILRWVSGDG